MRDGQTGTLGRANLTNAVLCGSLRQFPITTPAVWTFRNLDRDELVLDSSDGSRFEGRVRPFFNHAKPVKFPLTLGHNKRERSNGCYARWFSVPFVGHPESALKWDITSAAL